MSTKEDLKRMRDEYTRFALDHLTLCETHNGHDLQRTAEKLWIHFAFPNLDDCQRQMLFDLHRARVRAAGAYNYEDLQDDVKADMKWDENDKAKAIQDFEKFHLAIMQSDMLDKMTPLQEELVKSAFTSW